MDFTLSFHFYVDSRGGPQVTREAFLPRVTSPGPAEDLVFYMRVCQHLSFLL